MVPSAIFNRRPISLVRQPFGNQGHDLALAVCQHRQHVFRDRDGPSILKVRSDRRGGSGNSLWPSATCRKDCTRVSTTRAHNVELWVHRGQGMLELVGYAFGTAPIELPV